MISLPPLAGPSHYVIDACAAIAYFRHEAGGEQVWRIMTDSPCHIHSLNLCELHYDLWKDLGASAADQAIRILDSAGIQEHSDLDRVFWREISRLKAGGHRLSLADACCLTLARRLDAVVPTADHHEFDPFAREGACRIHTIR